MSPIVAAALIIVGTGCAAVLAEVPADATTLREAAGNKLMVGAAVMSYQLEEPRLGELVAREFNCMTGENEFKPSSVHPKPGRYDFAAADKIIAFAKQHDMKVVGHTLLWHQQAPAFLFKDDAGLPLPREQALANLKDHIETVMHHFKGNVIGWDVVNEAISDKPEEYLRDTPARQAIGNDYIEKAFQFAAAADPAAQLYYNDYSTEFPAKREKALRLLKSLQSAGVKVTGVGIQSHCVLANQTPQLFDDTITAFAGLGLKVMLTELDIDVLPRTQTGADTSVREQAADLYKSGLPSDVAAAQAKYYGDLFKIVEKHADTVTRVTLWGTHDGTSWLNNWPVRGRTNYALLWDRQLQPKPAYHAVIGALTGN